MKTSAALAFVLAGWFGLSNSETLALQAAIGAVVISVVVSIYVLWRLDGVATAARNAESAANDLLARTEELESRLRRE